MRRVRLGVSGLHLRHNPDALLPAFLLEAMRRGEPLHLAGGLTGIDVEAIQETLARWWPDRYRRVPVHAAARRADPPASGVAAFFTGGLDSFYTARRHAQITHLVFVHGFDIALANRELRARVAGELRAAAAAMGLPLLEVETDLRERLDPHWESGHGAALATIAHQLAHLAGAVLVPATSQPVYRRPWGSHEDLDPLWSSERVTLVHDGTVSRVEKIAALADDPIFLRHLRVCWENRDNAYNCGRCLKCLRTMISLALLDRLGAARTFPDTIDPAAIRALRLDELDRRKLAEQLPEARERLPEVAAAIEVACASSR